MAALVRLPLGIGHRFPKATSDTVGNLAHGSLLLNFPTSTSSTAGSRVVGEVVHQKRNPFSRWLICRLQPRVSSQPEAQELIACNFGQRELRGRTPKLSSFYDRPILNSPYRAPELHHPLDKNGQPLEGEPKPGRRPSRLLVPVPASRKKASIAQAGLHQEPGDAGRHVLLASRYDVHLFRAALRHQVQVKLASIQCQNSM